MSDILITGFLPESAEVGNASAQLIHYLRDQGTPWATALLQQSSAQLINLIPEHLAEHRPRLTILCGQAPGRNRISLEAVALNILDFRVADVDGFQPSDVPIIAEGPLAYRSGLDLAGAVGSLRTAGHPVHLSFHAGCFLCNEALFLTLHHLQPESRALFFHIPLSPSQVIDEPRMADKPCLPTATVAEALKALVANLDI